ncbi:hypothetical protein H8356DRAFT_1270391 [Neocallimastix lanati (nom. inval.)]|uniref:C-type lectin domain-containing protein n=1 Tax=Neocallimastix californiae TaxID=1754190 RepID=A0A1Y2F8B0_9FUNG|nr:hypothetical protein H8356DRAFT_1270391 [Neocallimastix sp. JGI-2020a]ORY80103.1 hypothetical protein LY90DRAFT_622969 [Neocallimastix californiae]|eukprot:ORY80103.1 hypothetical protein LY90DRAFT_622969 [Neocallimastix californiae]
MNETLQKNIEYLFDFQTKLSYNLPISTVQLFETDLSSSILNNDQAIYNIHDVLEKGFRKLYVNITWDQEENNWKLHHTNFNKYKPYKISNINNYYSDSNNENSINNNNYTTINLIKNIREWIDNSNDCHIVILIFKLNILKNFYTEKSIPCIDSQSEKLKILKHNILSEIKDIIYTVNMMKEGIYRGKGYKNRKSFDNDINKNWTSFRKLCYINKKILVGLESNGFLCNDFKDNILFTESPIIKKLIQYQDLKKKILYSTSSPFRSKKIVRIIKLIDKRNSDNLYTNDSDIDINDDLSIIFTPDDTININKEVIDIINRYHMSVHMKTFNINSIQALKHSLLWSWDIHTNFIEDSSNSCVVFNRITGRWNFHSCKDNFPIVCKNKDDPLIWMVILNDDKCEENYIFSLPHSFEENHILWETILQNRTLSSYKYFYLSKTPININENIISNKQELKNFNSNWKYNEKYLIIPSNLEYVII